MISGRSATFSAVAVPIEDSVEGAVRYLSWLAKPTNPKAQERKLLDWVAVQRGQRPSNNRSRANVLSGLRSLGRGLRTAIEAGDLFDRYWQDSIKRTTGIGPEEYGKSLAASIGGGRDERGEDLVNAQWRVWRNWRPVAHAAAAFRVSLFIVERGEIFMRTEDDAWPVEFASILEDRQWLAHAIEGGIGRLGMCVQAGIQFPANTVSFVPK